MWWWWWDICLNICIVLIQLSCEWVAFEEYFIIPLYPILAIFMVSWYVVLCNFQILYLYDFIHFKPIMNILHSKRQTAQSMYVLVGSFLKLATVSLFLLHVPGVSSLRHCTEGRRAREPSNDLKTGAEKPGSDESAASLQHNDVEMSFLYCLNFSFFFFFFDIGLNKE